MATGAEMNTKVKDALDHVRAMAQELHGTISDAAAKTGGAAKADFEAFLRQADAVSESIKDSIGAQDEATRKHLTDALTHLRATREHAAEGLKSSGQAVQASAQQALAGARAFVQKVSETVAAKRSADASHNPKK